MSEENIFERDLDQTVANHQTQTPLSFLAWAAAVYPDKAAVIHGDKSYTYAELIPVAGDWLRRSRVGALASATL